MTPELDKLPPILHSDEYYKPVPLGSAVNTAGAEDSPFITPDGQTLYFFFTPDPDVPAEEQLFDGATGIYVSRKEAGQWTGAERIILQYPGELALDGCQFVLGNIMWFCTAREGNYRGVDFWTTEFIDGDWTNWQNAGEKLNVEYGIGEMHITADGRELYYHSDQPGGLGGVDIWRTRKENGEWQEPENVTAVNSADTDGWPFISEDGGELWFLRWYLGSSALFRSKWSGNAWGEPELIISQFAGEPTLDNEGNLYFVHHFIENGRILDADIYVAYRK